MTRKNQARRIISLFLSVSMILSIALSNTAIAYQEAVDTISAPEHGPTPVPAPIAEAPIQNVGETESSRTLEDLIAADYVLLDEDGNIARIEVSDESGLSAKNAMLLMGNAQSYDASGAQQSTANRIILDSLGLTEGDIRSAIDFHGSSNVFYGEVSTSI